jgi:hypothetical protein
MVMAAGPRMTTNNAGKIKIISGIKMVTGNLAAVSSAL